MAGEMYIEIELLELIEQIRELCEQDLSAHAAAHWILDLIYAVVGEEE